MPNSCDSMNISSVFEFGVSLGDSDLIIEKANGFKSSHFRKRIHSREKNPGSYSFIEYPEQVWTNLFNLVPNSCRTVSFQISIICLGSSLTLINSQVQRFFLAREQVEFSS